MQDKTRLFGQDILDDDWLVKARCATEDPELFFIEGKSKADKEVIRQARRICRDCPVILECLNAALANKEAFGVWGGLTAGERSSNQRYIRTAGFTRTALYQFVSQKSAGS